MLVIIPVHLMQETQIPLPSMSLQVFHLELEKLLFSKYQINPLYFYKALFCKVAT